jgi:peptide chain release factor 1
MPLADEMPSNGTDDLLRLEDVRVEVMRARGAGGQVSPIYPA